MTTSQRAGTILAAIGGGVLLARTWRARKAIDFSGMTMTMTNRLLPSATDASGDEARSGWQSTSRWVPSAVTTLSDRASADNNELGTDAHGVWAPVRPRA